jgi:hypothetical protein
MHPRLRVAKYNPDFSNKWLPIERDLNEGRTGRTPLGARGGCHPAAIEERIAICLEKFAKHLRVRVLPLGSL